jgi:hypothetical protein
VNDTEAVPGNLSVRGRELTELLRVNPDITMVDAQRIMGITHKSWFYKIRDSLVRNGVLYPGENPQLPAPFTTRMAHPQQSTRRPSHAPVRHAWWDDEHSHWAVQGALLDRWDLRSWPEALPDEVAIVVRRAAPRRNGGRQCWSWVASRRARWTTERTAHQLVPSAFSIDQLERLTLAVAWAMSTDAVIPPGAEVRSI